MHRSLRVLYIVQPCRLCVLCWLCDAARSRAGGAAQMWPGGNDQPVLFQMWSPWSFQMRPCMRFSLTLLDIGRSSASSSRFRGSGFAAWSFLLPVFWHQRFVSILFRALLSMLSGSLTWVFLLHPGNTQTPGLLRLCQDCFARSGRWLVWSGVPPTPTPTPPRTTKNRTEVN